MEPISTNRSNSLLAFGCIILASVSRIALPPLFGHPGNFSPIDAIALFSGACFGRKLISFIIPLFSVWISDMIVDYGFYHKFMWFYPGFYWQYSAYIVIVLIGFAMTPLLINSKQSKLIPGVIGASLLSSVLFFLMSNFGVWASFLQHAMYPHTFSGLATCYVMAIPFFSHTLLSDLVYSSILFGAFYMLRSPVTSRILVKQTLNSNSKKMEESNSGTI